MAPPSALPSALPIPPTPLVGREHEEAAVSHLVQRQDVRLLTLTGPPGIGKTRLALQVAAGLNATFADGVVFVGLAAIQDPTLVLAALAQALGVHDMGDQPLHETLAVYLRDRRLLLVLDNFEQVVAAAPLLADLLASCPKLAILVTSRTVLRLRGEQEFTVPPLALPDPSHLLPPEELMQYAAVALFMQRARAVKPPFALTPTLAATVAAICQRLDGLPLAIELAAAKVRVLPPPHLLARLERRLPMLTSGARDLPERQQTMRATLAWSEDLLSVEEQWLFRRLAVFVGGFTLEAAEAVCAAPAGAEPLGRGVLEGLERLVDQSLVQQQMVGQDGADEEEGGGEAYFRLLYVIREYALERLEASAGGAGGQVGQEAEALRRAHAVYYLGLVEERALATVQPEGAAWMERLEREHDNFRAALAWAREQGEAELGLRLAGSLGPFWDVRGYRTEGRGWVEGLLALAPRAVGDRARAGDDGGEGAPGVADVSAVARAKALVAASNFAWRQGDDERAQAAAAEGLALARDQQAGWAAGVALNMLGVIAWDRGDLVHNHATLSGIARWVSWEQPK